MLEAQAFLSIDEADPLYEADDELLANEEELLIPYETDGESDDGDNDTLNRACSSEFFESGWGTDCLQEPENIDFDLVYALHTFVATVEGQANATKGDEMVLLDDSNSYWWLVRVVKDSSIGWYLLYREVDFGADQNRLSSR